MRRLLLLMLGLVLLSTQLLAQNRTITGHITDGQGSAVAGASVTIKGTKVGTTTSIDGQFSLSVPPSAKTLVISSVGFQSKEISLGDAASVSVSLTSANSDMNAVVVVAYGTQKRESITGSVATVGAKQLETRLTTNIS